MDPAIKVLLWWLAFGGTHTVLTHPPIRSAVTGSLGEKGFSGIYAVISFATFVPLVWTFFANRVSHAKPLLAVAMTPGLEWVTMLLMLLAVLLLVLGFAQPSPLSLAGARSPSSGIGGVLRITRHPVFMAFAIFGLAHCLVNSSAIDRVFFGGMLVYSLIGCAHQDWRKQQSADEKTRRFFAETSFFPFAAIASGRNRFELGELAGKSALIALVVFVVIFAFHHRWFG